MTVKHQLAQSQVEAQQQINLNALYLNFQNQVLNYIRNNGLRLGNRWIIRQESSFLVFRDLLSGGDKRYAMAANRYVDL